MALLLSLVLSPAHLLGRLVRLTPLVGQRRALFLHVVGLNAREARRLSLIVELLGSADKRLLWLEESYHVATLDNDKERIAEESLAFIRAHS